MAKRTRAQKISDKTTMDIYPGPTKASAEKEIAEYAKDVELIKLYGDDAMRAKTFNTRETLKTKGQNRGRKYKPFTGETKLTPREEAAAAARNAKITGGGRGDGNAERLSLIRKELIKNKTLDKDGNFTKSLVSKAKGGMIGGKKRYMNGGMVMSNRGVRDTKMS